ncbi:MAG TPA: zinc ribbon domain-containing protein [Phycisphaerales bacterium]|nr:zinc ribbon domain-containing protein [Phycisphaerales bacterium]
MPIYEYSCENCGRQLELLVSSSRVKPACPHCSSKRLTRKFSTFAAHSGSAQPQCPSGTCPGATTSACASGKCPFSR